MATLSGSPGNRTYSDPSYGSIKQFSFTQVTTGTRGAAHLQTWSPLNPITILDWQIPVNTAGTGGNQAFVLLATSAAGTAALGTITLATHAAGTVCTCSTTNTNVSTGGYVTLYGVEGTGFAFNIAPVVSYRERFVEDES